MATAEQTVSAVLEGTNKRYLVEHWENKDGTMWYDRYSDGRLEQGGFFPKPQQTNTQVVFPIEFSNLNYTLAISVTGDTSQYGYDGGYRDRLTTGFTFCGTFANAAGNEYSWHAIGK